MYAKNVVHLLILASVIVIFTNTSVYGIEKNIDLQRFKVDLLYKKYQLTGSDKVKDLLLTEINNSLNYISMSTNPQPAKSIPSHTKFGRKLGMRVIQLRDHLEIKAVFSIGSAIKGGLKAGDIITEVLGIRVRTIQHLEMILNSKSRGSSYNFTVIRGGKTITRKVNY
ncbi:PDZ domain-containing protein [bacterium]|nr:PDZ domain-containing protein [bacterium]